MTKRQIRKNQTLYNQFKSQLEKKNLGEWANNLMLEEEIERRKIYERYQRKLVKFNIIPGY